jgi:hypothetical protein
VSIRVHPWLKAAVCFEHFVIFVVEMGCRLKGAGVGVEGSPDIGSAFPTLTWILDIPCWILDIVLSGYSLAPKSIAGL